MEIFGYVLMIAGLVLLIASGSPRRRNLGEDKKTPVLVWVGNLFGVVMAVAGLFLTPLFGLF